VTILAGDVGGTTTRLALFTDASGAPASIERYMSEEHRGLGDMVARFLATHPAQVTAAAFGVAGPVVDGRTETVNLAWPVDETSLRERLGLDRVWLLNDLEANAWGIPLLGPADLAVLQEGAEDPSGTIAVISAGTGLGQAIVVRDRRGDRILPTEGGHADFAPASALQEELLGFLRAELGHVSWERVCSGMGLVNIERFLRTRAGEPEPAWAADGDAAAIGRHALEDTDLVSTQALEMMVEIYGAQAGNLALAAMATGGVYVGGGIAPKILPQLRDGRFLHAFAAKGRFSALLSRIPVRVILDELTALRGAAHRAASP